MDSFDTLCLSFVVVVVLVVGVVADGWQDSRGGESDVGKHDLNTRVLGRGGSLTPPL